MNLDEEFEKMYGGSGAASAAPDLEAEFAKIYGGEQKPRAWEEGDGGSARLPEGETNEWGGNLRNEGRKVLIRRDKDGKVNGYSTTSSIPVKDADGKIAIVPTVVDGKELTPDEAVRHYAETGEHWGKADDEDSARKIAQAVHERHAEDNQKSWNEYIHSHWDEMSDNIRNDPGTRYQHKKRTGEETSLMERLANDDSEDDVKKWKSESDYEEVTDTMGLPIGRQPISRSGKSDEDALAAIAKEAGLADWQVERIRRGSKDAAEMRKNLAYVAGNRVGGGTDDGKKGGKLTDYIRSAAGAVTHAIADRIPDVTRLAGTVLGGEGDVEQPVMVDDQYSRKEDEDVRQWARRKGIHLNRKNFDAWNEFFKWEAPVEGKEGMRESRSLMAPGNRTKSWDAKSFGDKLVAIANEEQADLEKFVPRHLTGNAVMNFVEDTASGIGGFMFAGPLMIPTAGANSYQRTREEAVRAGKSDEEARGTGIAMGAFDAALTAAFYAAPVKKWMKSKGMRPVENFKSGSYADMRRSFGNYFAKQAVLDQSAAALEAGAIMGVQGAGDRFGEMMAGGKDVDLGDIAITGIEGAVEGAAIGLVMGAAHVIGARHAGRKYYDTQLREAVKTPEGVVALARLNPDGTAAFCEAFERGGLASAKEVDAAGLPPMKAADRVNHYQKLKQLGISSDVIRKNTRIGGSAPEAGTPGPSVTATVEEPPSETLAKRIRAKGVEPVKFKIPEDENGKPKFVYLAWHENRSGKEGKNPIAIDANTGTYIIDNLDGTFTACDNLNNSVDSNSLESAIENANELALAQQYNDIERQKKIQVIQNEHAAHYGNKRVHVFATMSDAINQIGAAIQRGDAEGAFGIKSVESLVNPNNGFREDRQAFHTPDGTTVMIVDNIDSPADAKRLLRHEIVGHGGPNSEFGDGVDEFLASVDSEEMSSRRQKLIEQGMSEADVDSPRGKREIFANMLQERAHNPNVKQRIGSWLNDRARKIGAKKTYSDADIEVMAARWEKEARGTNGSMDLREPGDRFEFIELAEEPTQIAPAETHENALVSAPNEKGTTSRPNETAQPTVKEEAKSEVSAKEDNRVVETAQEVAANRSEEERAALTDVMDVSGLDTGTKFEPNGDFLSKMSSDDRPIVRLNPHKLDTSDKYQPNIKGGANRKTGITSELPGEYQPSMAGTIMVRMVMDRDDGGNVKLDKNGKPVWVATVITGRHRTDMARRHNKPIYGRVFWEDEMTREQASVVDAVANIHDEKGSINDYIKFLDNIKPTREQAEQAGILSGKGLVAWSIYADATEAVRRATALDGSPESGQIDPREATAIAEAAPRGTHERNAFIQSVLLRSAQAGMKGKAFVGYCKEMTRQLQSSKVNKNLLAGEQMDLFHDEDFLAMEALTKRRNEYRTRKSNQYAEVASGIRAALNREGKLQITEDFAKDLGITDKTDRKQLEKTYDIAHERAEYWDPSGDRMLNEGDIAAMDAEISAKADANAAKREEIQKKAAEKIAAVKEKRTGKKSDVAVSKTETTTNATAKKKSAVEKTEVQKMSDLDLVTAYHKDRKNGELADEVSKRGIYSSKRTSIVPYRDENGNPRVGTSPEVTTFFNEKGDEIAKFDAGEEPVKTPVKSREEELTGQEKARSAANAAFSAMTGIPVVQVGKNGKILSDSTPAAEKAISGKGAGKSAVNSQKVEKGKFKSVEEAEKARKEREDLAALFDSPEFDPEYEKQKSDVNRAVDFALNGNPVAELSGKEFAPTGKNDLVDRVEEFFKSIGGKAVNEELGEVLLNRASVKSSLGHGIGREKAAAFAAVPAVIQNGIVFDRQKNWKGRGVDSFVLAAPIKIGNEMYVCEAIVEQKSDGNERRFYLHEVNLQSQLSETIKTPTGGAGNGKPARPVRSILAQLARKFNGENSDVERYIRWTDKYHLNPYKKSHVKEFERKNGVQFASDEFDPAVFQKRVGAMAVLAKRYVDNGIGTFEEIVADLRKDFPEKFGNMKPYLRGIWNAVADQMNLPDVSREQANDVFARIEKPSESKPTVEKPTEKAQTKGERISNAADELVALIEKGEKFDRRTLEETVAKHLGGSVAEGTFTPKDASDILELAVNRVVLKRNDDLSASANASVDEAVGAIGEIRKILGVLPTQTVRSDEQIKMQQFSTPPHEAFAVNWVANIRPGDVALEPSAGIGGIAVFAKASGARKIVANELSDRRREILNELGIADNLYGVDAAKIWQHLFWEVNKGNAERPTVVVMNPPFSSSVVSGRHSTIGVGGAHIEAALNSLAQGGRLVAVVGNGMSYDSPSKSAAAWWKKIGSKYRVMANVRVNGNEYAKYGTDFDNNIIVIDKVEPDPTVKPVFGKIESLDEFPALMEGVRNARPGSDQQTESASDKQGGRGGNETPRTGLVSVGISERSGSRNGNRGSSGNALGGRGRASGETGSTGKDMAGGSASGNVGSGTKGLSGQDKSRKGRDSARPNGSDDVRNGADELGEAGGRADSNSGLLAVSDLKSENPQGGNEDVRTVGDGTFAEYKPSKLNIPGMKPHPGEIVESAAMASVKTPDIAYSPRIPKELVEKGQPSAAQLEVITLAGQAGEQKLPNGQRRGFFTQDGTGMGKGTELAGIICDNLNHGRKKAIWISKNEDLFADAKRDLSTYGLEKDAFLFGKKKASGNIAFLSYKSLTTGSAFDDKGGVTNKQGERSKFLDLVSWFGKDYDGVIIFDESHMMANVEGKQSDFGKGEGAKQAKMAVKLQEMLPNARVVYASATGATEVSHLACLPRLGLWGEGTSFKTKGEFIDKISKGGLSMMEMVARDMKAAGLTLSRSLTMEGIVNRTLKHDLSPDQTRRYNECAAAWQEVYDNALETLAATGGIHGRGETGKIIGGMKTAQQQFFNSLLTSMMLPSVIADMKRNLADGKSIVIQLTQTNEAALKKNLANKNDPDFDPEGIDTSPREILRNYVTKLFPTHVWTEKINEDGKKEWVIAKDSEGNNLEDPAAVAKKQEILDKIDMMRMDGSPLDAILEEFGYDKVAEVTGRTKRIERIERDGEVKSVVASRSKKKGEAEANEFNAGKRRILIFSEAGGTGKSYHASRTYENQQQRVHYLLQAGWSAPPAIQGLGRTNRTNQASKPEYVLCTTDVKGHLRFVSSVARRLQQMGSLTSGDRSTAGNGVFNEDQNIEDRYSEMALKNIFRDLYYNNREEFNRVCNIFGYIRPKVDTETGERTNKNLMLDPETGELDAEKIPGVTEFLNTMLHLRIDDMNRFFDQFMQTRNDLIETAKQNGKYDPGLEKLIAEKIVEKSRTPIYEDPATGSKTEVVELGVSHKSRKRSYETVEKMMEDARRAKRRAFFATNKQSGMLYSFVETPYTETDDKGVVHAKFYRFAPDGTSNILRDSEVRIEEDGNYTQIEDGEASWRAEYDKVPDLIEGNNYYVTGAILPVFGRLGIEDPRVKRIEPTGKKTSFLGLEIPNSMVDQVMSNFGEGDASAANSPGAVYRRIVNDGKGVDLQRDGWKLRRARVNYDTAIELVGLEGPEEARRLEQLGYGRFDRSSGKPRFFIPRTEAGVAKFLADYPVKVDEAPQVFFDSPEFDPEAEEKTFGITNADEKFMLEAASMPVPKHVTKADDVLMVQAEHLLSNRDFMRKLAHAVAQKARPTSDAQNVALGIYSEQCADALNAAKQAYDDMVAELELLPPDADQETVDVTKKSIAALRKELAGARRDFREAAMAKRAGASEQGRALRTNRFLFSTADYSYAGLRGIVQSEIGKAEIPEEMDAEIGKLAGNFKDLDERSRKMAVERLKLFAQKVVNDLKAGGRKASLSGPKAAGNELKRVMRNYEDALNQVQVHADEAGGTLIGMADQLYPSWGKWLKAIGEYHCFMNPDITEQEVIDAIRADLGRYLTDGIDEETVRDVLTGFGHNYRQSRYDSQRKMNDLKAQALSKRQRDYMIENGKLPPQTGMVRDDPSDETRALRKEVQQIKKDIDEQEGGPRALKGALASAKTRVRNTIADLENAIAHGERIERSHRTLMEDAELQQLKKRRDELREEYEAMFGEKSALTDEQRLQRAEKMLRKTLERALERLSRAQSGDFSTAPRFRLDNATTAQLREEIANTNKIIRDLKDAAYPMGTPEEIAKKNANKMKRREEAIQRLQARIISGDIRPQAKPIPPMPPDMQKQYDALGDQMKAAHRRLQQLREEARHATWFAVPRAALDGFNYVVGSVMSNAASYDRSAVLRQALRLTAAKPVEAVKAYAKAEKAAWNEDYFNEVNDKLLADPIINEGMEKYGLRLHSTDIAHVHTIELFKTPNTVEPRIVTRIGQMIGGIPVIGKIGKKAYGAHTYIKAGSERHYITYLNLMAGQTYKLLVDAVPGGASDFQKRKFAGLVNILTGAASIPENLRHGINMVNTIGGNVAPVIWSPSLWMSQIQQVGLADVWGAYIGKKDDVKPGANAYAEATYVAKEAMKLRIRAGLAIAALGALLSYAFGDDDWWNELVTDVRRSNLWRVWNKIHHPVIGKTHIDLEMGERAFSRTLGALVTGKTETSAGRTKELGSYGAGDWYNMFGRYVGGKFSPAYGGIVSLLQKRDYIGNPYGFKEFASSWIPLSVGDVFQSAMEDSWLDGTAPAAVAMTMLGAGGSVYDEKYYERTVNPFLESVKDIEKTVSDPLLDREEKDMVVKNIKDAAGGIFSDDRKWHEAYGLAKQISAEDGKLKKAIKQFETAQASGRKFDETSAVKNIEKATGALDAQKRRLMEMIQQGKDNYLRPWRR